MNRSIALRQGDIAALLAIQLILVAIVAGVFLVSEGMPAAGAAAYGGAIALLSAWMLGRGVLRAAEVAKSNPGSETTVLYVGAAQRFLVVLVLFGLGMGWLGLLPVPLLVAFAIAQLGHVFNGAFVRWREGGRRMEGLG